MQCLRDPHCPWSDIRVSCPDFGVYSTMHSDITPGPLSGKQDISIQVQLLLLALIWLSSARLYPQALISLWWWNHKAELLVPKQVPSMAGNLFDTELLQHHGDHLVVAYSPVNCNYTSHMEIYPWLKWQTPTYVYTDDEIMHIGSTTACPCPWTWGIPVEFGLVIDPASPMQRLIRRCACLLICQDLVCDTKSSLAGWPLMNPGRCWSMLLVCGPRHWLWIMITAYAPPSWLESHGGGTISSGVVWSGKQLLAVEPTNHLIIWWYWRVYRRKYLWE